MAEANNTEFIHVITVTEFTGKIIYVSALLQRISFTSMKFVRSFYLFFTPVV